MSDKLPPYVEGNYLDAYLDLIPSGQLWNKEPDSPMVQALSTLIPTYSRLSDSATNLLIDSFIGTTQTLLPEWQASLGLPDPCLGDDATFEEQRAQAVARFIGVEGQSVAFFTAYAANLGYTITIDQYTNFHVGSSKVGSSKVGNLAFSWVVNAPAAIIDYFKVGSSKAGEKLVQLDSDVLQCELTAIAPAHTALFFNFYAGSYIDVNFIMDKSVVV